MNFARLRSVIKKEFKHLFRDFRLLAILLIFPVFLLVIFGYSINFDVQNVRIAVKDDDHSKMSRDFIESLNSTSYFDLAGYLETDSEISEVLNTKKAQCVVHIPKGLSVDVRSGKTTEIQFLIDGVDGNTAKIIQNYMEAATLKYSSNIKARGYEKRGLTFQQPLSFEPVFWYNPDLQTTKFLMPGLIALILIVTATLSVSLSIVREKERGTIEQLTISAIRTPELLLGKIIPYILLSLFDAIFILSLGYILFGAGVEGSFLLLFITIFIFLLSSTSLGIFVSAVSNSQQVAFTLGTFITLLPSLILSGFIFQIESMPEIIQLITNITPAKFFITALRAIMLRGTGIETFYEQLLYLLLFSVVLLVLAGRIYIVKQKNA